MKAKDYLALLLIVGLPAFLIVLWVPPLWIIIGLLAVIAFPD